MKTHNLKHVLCLFFFLSTVILSAQFSGGTGSKVDPYLVTDAEELDSVRYYLNGHFKLINDIDLSGFENWLPLGTSGTNFTGSFDGDGHVVKNMKRTSGSYVGLFGYYAPSVPKDSIKNIGVVGYEIKNASSRVAPIIGYAYNASLINSFAVEGEIQATNDYVGGLIGYANTSVVKNCYSSGTINTSAERLGGLVGYAYYSDIEYCYSASEVKTTSTYVYSYAGGLTGYIYYNKIENCVGVNPSVEGGGENYIYRLAGYAYPVTSCYGYENTLVNGKTISGSHSYHGSDISKAQMSDSLFYKDIANWQTAAWDFTNVWTLDSLTTSPYPILKKFTKSAQQVKHPQSIDWVQSLVGKPGGSIKLMANSMAGSVNFISDNPEVASISNDTLFIHKKGNANLTAFTSESNYFEIDSITRTFTLFADGGGTKEDPYLISTVNQLDSVRYSLEAYYMLTSDIDLGSIENWKPLGTSSDKFTGGFDGNGHVIRNLTIDTINTNNIGLIGYYEPKVVGDSIKNLGLIAPKVTGGNNVGAFIGYSYYGSLYKCFVIGEDTIAGDSYTGALIGYGYNGVVSNSYTSVNVYSTNNYCGGIVGYAYGTNINYSYSVSPVVTMNNNYANGIAYSSYPARVENCFAINPMISGNSAFRISYTGYRYNNYAWGEMPVNGDVVSGSLNSNQGLDTTLAQFTDTAFFKNPTNWYSSNPWDFDTIWYIDTLNESRYPVLKGFDMGVQKVKHIQKLSWLQNIAGTVNDTVILNTIGNVNEVTYKVYLGQDVGRIVGDTLFIEEYGNIGIAVYAAGSEYYLADTLTRLITIFNGGSGEIDNPFLISNEEQLNGVRNNLNAHYKLVDDIVLDTYSSWESIGDDINPFTGSFDGGGHSISNLNVSRLNQNYNGFFASFIPSNTSYYIKNLGIERATIEGQSRTGVLAGYSYYGVIDSCYIKESTVSGYDYTGGLVGESHYTEFSNCAGYDNTINGTSNYTGGLIGYARYGSMQTSYINNCYIQTSSSYTGGLTGYQYFTDLTSCFATGGQVNGNSYLGGLAGRSYYADITNCYSTTPVRGISNYIGGIAGSQYYADIANSYSSSPINGGNGNYVGGVAGYLNQGYLINSFAANAGIDGYSSGTYRVVGYNNGYLVNNYGLKSIVVNGIPYVGSSDYNGADTSLQALMDSSFYTAAGNWDTNPWDFNSVWTMDTTAVSAFPILQGIPTNYQSALHKRVLYWNQNLEGEIGDTILLNAIDLSGISAVEYTSENQSIANISGDTLFVKAAGFTEITATLGYHKFFESDTTVKVFALFNSEGTKNDPHLISTVQELKAVNSYLDAYYKLVEDLDLSTETNWEPIGNSDNPFRGGFDGNGHVIANLTIESAYEQYQGLFGYYNPIYYNDSIKNLYLENVQVKGANYSGALAGYFNRGVIYGCYAKGEVSGTNYTGGLVGQLSSGKLYKSFADVDVDGNNYVGGLTGASNYSNITDSYTTGNVFGTENIGGLSGYLYSTTFDKTYATGYIKGDYSVGGLVGYSRYSTSRNNIAANASIMGVDNVHRIIGRLQSGSLYSNYGWDNMYINCDTVIGTLNDENGKDALLSDIKDDAFYDQTELWNDPWNISEVWDFDPRYSPYPILRAFAKATQKVMHAQVLCDSLLPVLPLDATAGDVIEITELFNGPVGSVKMISDNTDAAKITPKDVFAAGLGTATIMVYYPGSEFYEATDTIIRTITCVNTGGQEIKWPQTLVFDYGDGEVVLKAKAGSRLPIEYSSDNASVVSISGNKVVVHEVGTANITATQPGNSNFTAAESVTRELVVGKARLIVGVENATMSSGQSLPEFEFRYSGFVSGEDENVLDTKPVATTEATSASEPGNYDVTLSGGDDNHYWFEFEKGVLIITQAVGISDNSNDNINIYPTVVTDQLTIDFTLSEQVGYVITNMQGATVKKGELVMGENTLNISDLENAVYLITIQGKQFKGTYLIVKK